MIYSMNTDSFSAQQRHNRGSSRRAQMREALLHSAKTVFAERGYHDTSIAEITTRADMGVGTFYLYFKDKEEIFETIIVEGIEHIKMLVQEAVEAAPEHKFETFFRAILQFAYSDRELFRIALTGEGKKQIAVRAYGSVNDGISELLNSATEKGYLGNEYPLELLAHFLTGILNQTVIYWFLQDEPKAEAMADYFIAFLKNGVPASLFNF